MITLVPKFPCTNPSRYRPYWETNGSLRWYFSSMSCTTGAVGADRSQGGDRVPGIRNTAPKMMKVTPTKT